MMGFLIFGTLIWALLGALCSIPALNIISTSSDSPHTEFVFPVPCYIIGKASDYNLMGKIILIVFGNIFFAPFTILWAVVISILIMGIGIKSLFNSIFKKKSNREEKAGE